MNFERYSRIMSDLDECIHPKNERTFTFDGSGCEWARRLFLTGETNIDPFWKSEPDYQMLYRASMIPCGTILRTGTASASIFPGNAPRIRRSHTKS